MTAHLLAHPENRAVRRATDLFRLDCRAYWLFVSILSGILGLTGVISLAWFALR